MPVKRRADKRRNFDEMKIEDQHYGPGTCLLNGCGYLAPHGDGRWPEKSEAVQAAVLAEMRDDWERHSEAIMEAWHARTPHDLYCAREFHGSPELPWAVTQFGRAKCQ